MEREIGFPFKVYEGTSLDIEGIVERLGFREPVYYTGPTTKRYSPRADVIVGSPFVEEIETDVAGDVVVGVGGCKVMDAAKHVAKRKGLPFILVPTSPSSDCTTSPAISLFRGTTRYSDFYQPPYAIIMDMEILVNAPKMLKLSGFGDVVSKYSSVYDWKLSNMITGEYFGYLTSSMLLFALRYALRYRNLLGTERGIRSLMESLLICGASMSIQGSSRPASGSEHLISHALDIIHLERGEKPRSHGIQVGLATVITTFLQGRNWSRVKEWLYSAGFPPTFEDIGVDRDTLIEAILRAPSIRKRFTVLSLYPMNKKTLEKVLDVVGV